MRNRWDDTEAAGITADCQPLAECVYASRLLGADPGLVLVGGGNSSVKVAGPGDGTGDGPGTVLYVKGSGHDLASIGPAAFPPLRLDRVLALLERDKLTDSQMMHELRCACLVPGAPDPSVETLLHALLPYPVVLHSHADAVLALTNTPRGPEIIREVYGDSVVSVPYVMPGFDLARCCAGLLPGRLGPGVTGVILLNHGIFTFAGNAREAYFQMIELVTLAERYITASVTNQNQTPGSGGPGQDRAGLPASEISTSGITTREIATLRQRLSREAGVPLILTRRRDAAIASFLREPSLMAATQRGPATPDHVIRTKRLPLIGRGVAEYSGQYRDYFGRHEAAARTPVTMLDPAPRVVLDPELGLAGAGRRAADADGAAEIYRHTMSVISAAEGLGGYQALPEADIFDMEYWELEQAKLKRSRPPAEFTGEVALVTGAASGIGRACALALAARGASVAGIDISPAVEDAGTGPGYLGIVADVTSPGEVQAALARTVDRYGGLDILVSAAGIFGASAPLVDQDDAAWQAALAVNTGALWRLLAAAHPLLALAPGGGRVVLIGSRNVTAPGPGAGPYSAAKAAATQIARVAALEWAADAIRVNIVHPDAVFDTGLWTEDLLRERAARYGLSVPEYKRRNLLRTEVTSATVGQAVAALCSAAFAATTGAQIPIDGGSERTV